VEEPAHVKVEEDGTVLGDLHAQVIATCRSGLTSVPAIAKVALKRARIAPDGTVVAEATTKGATPAHVTLTGNLHDRHFSGELTTAYLSCTGSRDIEADLGSKPQQEEPRGLETVVALLYRMHHPLPPQCPVAGDVGTRGTPRDAYGGGVSRLGAERSQVQILSPRYSRARF
jgi:hypothetical protein